MDATLQLITDQFRELKSEIFTITAEFKTEYVHSVPDRRH